jgi:hypothetical protein
MLNITYAVIDCIDYALQYILYDITLIDNREEYNNGNNEGESKLASWWRRLSFQFDNS